MTTTSANVLYDILRKIPSNTELDFHLKTENKLSLKAQNSDFNLLCLPSANFPSFDDNFQTSTFEINNKKFLSLLNKTKISISSDDTRHLVIFLHLTKSKDKNYLTGVATDSHRLSSSSIEIDNLPDFSSIILPRKTAFQLCNLLSENPDKFMISLSENKIKFQIGKISLTSKVIDGKFPDYQKVIPKDNDKSLTVPLNDFVNSVERVVSVSIDRKEGVKLDINKGKLKLSVNSTNSGDGNEVIPVKYDYVEITIGFNSKYLLDIASLLKVRTYN